MIIKAKARDSLQFKDTQRLKVTGWKQTVHANGNQKKAKVVSYISQNRLQDKECNKKQRRSYHDIGDNTIREYNICKSLCTNIEAPKYIKRDVNWYHRNIKNQKVIYEQLYAKQLDNPEEMDTFDLPRLNHKE